MTSIDTPEAVVGRRSPALRAARQSLRNSLATLGGLAVL